MSKSHNFFDVSRKSEVKIVEPSRKSQARARERIKKEFFVYDKAHSKKVECVIIPNMKKY